MSIQEKVVIRFSTLKKKIGASRSTIFRWERAGTFPKHILLRPNSTGWLLHEVKEVFPFKGKLKNRKTFLPHDFKPNEEHIFHAKTKDLDIFERLNQFKASCNAQRKQSYDWDEEFKAYLLGCFKRRCKPYRQR